MKNDFKRWCRIKEKINDVDDRIVYFRKKEVWWCALGANIGYEQDGKNEHFERPILIVKKINRYLLLAVPLSTKIKNHPYYHTYKFDTKKYSALLLQMRVISSKRLLRRVGSLDKNEFERIVDNTSKFVKE